MATVVRTARSADIPACGQAMYEAFKDIASVDEFADPGIAIPTGNAELFRWCLDSGLRVVQQMILVARRAVLSAGGLASPLGVTNIRSI